MTRKIFCLKLPILLIIIAFGGTLYAQRGTPPFGTYAGGSFDVINLQNLNVHFAIPVFSRAGRGIPFTHSISYDSTVWVPMNHAWVPVQDFGWLAQTAAQTGYITYYSSQGQCQDDAMRWHTFYEFSDFVYIDAHGTPHMVPDLVVDSQQAQQCSYPPGPVVGSGVTTDGSGWSLSAHAYAGYATASAAAPGGMTYNPPTQAPTGSATKSDTNGNWIGITSATTTTVTDTLGGSPVLTIAGSGTSSSPMVFSYTVPSGATASVTVKYTDLTIKTNFGCTGISDYGPNTVSMLTEIDLPDYTPSNNHRYLVEYEPTPGFSGDYTGRIAKITLPTGGYIAYTYTGGNIGIMCSDGTNAGLQRAVYDGASSNSWTYERTAGTGAAWTTVVTDPDPTYHNQTRYQFQGIYQTKKEAYQGSTTSGTLLQTVDTCYNGNTNISACTSTAVTLPISRVTSWSSYPSSGGKQGKTDTFYNSFQLPTEVDEYDFGSLGGGPGNLLRKTTIAYASLGNGIVNHPSTVSVYDGNGVLKANTTYGYDESAVTATSGTPQHNIVSGSRGNLTSVHRSTGSTTLNQTFTYYDTGNINVAADVNGAQTTYTYGACGNSFVTNVTLPLSLSRQAAWNCTGGVQVSGTDENGNITYTNYTTDPYYWRPESTKDAANNITSLAYSSAPGSSQIESAMAFNNGVSTIDVLTTTDSLGRPKLTQRRQAPGSSNFDSTQTDYDALGRVWQQYLAFQSTAGSPSPSFKGTTTTYDALGRPASVTDTGSGSVSVSYTYNDAYQEIGPAPTGENTKRKQLEYDGLGRLSSVCEVTAGTGSGTCAQSVSRAGFWTQYSYDTLGNLTGVTQNAQGTNQTRSFAFDRLSRMTSETNPENGTTSYTFDSDATCGTSNGDLVKRVDAVGNVTCFHYDALHRVTYISYPSGQYASVTPSKYFVYDSATINGAAMANPKARLVEAYTCTTCSPLTKVTDLGFSYSVRGEVTDVYESTPHSGGWYHVSGTYWASGALNQLIPNITGLPTITYGADGEGRLSSVSASAGTNPVTSTSYNVAGQVTDVTLGSADSDHYTYDPNTGRMTQYKFTIGATPQNVIGNLTWNANGSLGSLGITDPFNAANSQTCAYSHDDVSRISNVSCGSVWSQSFGFDPFGNISKSGSISFAAGYVPTGGGAPNNRIQTGIPNVSYDANGNLLTVTDGTSHTYSWDAEGKQLGIDSFGAIYDALGRMVELNNSGAYTEIVYGLASEKLALMSGQTLQKAYVATPSGTAVYTASGLSYYRHADWQGSSRFASTTYRTMYSSSAYAPFGEQYAAAGATDQNFTGQQPDTTSGLYDFLFRRLSQIQGRWLSPDPAGIAAVDPANPQSWNRFAYVVSNPLALIDPLGLDCAGGGSGSFAPHTPGAIVKNVVAPCPSPMPCEHFESVNFGISWHPTPLCLWTEYEPRNPAWAGPIGPRGGQDQKAANNGFTLGIRAPGQTFSDCMQQHAQDYSIAGTIDLIAGTNLKENPVGAFLAGNHVSSLFFGSGGEAAMTGVHAMPTAAAEGMGSTLAYGRYAPNVALDLSKAGNAATSALGWNTNLAARTAAQGAEKVLNLGLSLEMRLGTDIGFSLAEAVGCAIHR